MTNADNNALVLQPAHEVAHEVAHVDILTAGRLCLNCGHAAPEKFCANCGQNTHAHPPSAFEFLHEFVGHYVALEGKLWNSLARLLLRPGNLTREYVEGRRVRYINPLRLYLTMSVLFFALLKITHFSLAFNDLKPTEQSGNEKPAALAQARSGNVNQTPALAAPAKGGKSDSTVNQEKDDDDDAAVKQLITGQDGTQIIDGKEAVKQLKQKVGKPGTVSSSLIAKGSKLFERSSEEITEIMSEGFIHYAPYAMFCMLPLFALLLKMLYLGRNRNYGEHLVFAMHTNAFAFALFFALALTPWTWARTGLVLWLIAYLPLALYRVYGGNIVATALRWMILLTVYGICLSIAIVACLAAVVALY